MPGLQNKVSKMFWMAWSSYGMSINMPRSLGLRGL